MMNMVRRREVRIINFWEDSSVLRCNYLLEKELHRFWTVVLPAYLISTNDLRKQ
jgi:hypothetical protein